MTVRSAANPNPVLIKAYAKQLLKSLEEAAKKKIEAEKAPIESNKKEE